MKFKKAIICTLSISLLSSCQSISDMLHKHTFSEEWSYDDDIHYHLATCGHDLKSNEHKHSFDDENVEVENEYGKKGTYRVKTCSICDYSYEAVTIKWLDDDDAVLKIDENIKKGSIPKYDGTPEKDANEDGYYTFIGWDKEIVEANEDAIYRAKYEFTLTNVDDYLIFDYCNVDGKRGYSVKFEETKNINSLFSLEIPSTYNDSPVIKIEDFAFYSCENLYSIVLPDSIVKIGYCAFNFCQNLRSIVIPENVKTIGCDAFYMCENLSSITFPDSLTSIDWGAFSYCVSLKSIIIPKNVNAIGDGAFSSCVSLESLNVDSRNKVYDSRNGCNAIIETATNTLLFTSKNTFIPNGIKIIGDEAFCNFENLTSVFIPETVTTIGSRAFGYCTNLATISIPDSVTIIDGSAFWFCSNLTSVSLSNNLETIGSRAFEECPNLESIVIPASVNTIESYVFEKTTNCFYEGSISDYESLSSDKGGVWFIYSSTKPTNTNYNYWHYVNGVPTPW